MNSKMCLSLSQTLVITFLLVMPCCVTGFDIAKLLSQYPAFSTFSNYLTQTQLAQEINQRQRITVLAVDNSRMGPISGKSMELIKKIMTVHVVLDYLDLQQLHHLPSKTITLTTMFQPSSLNITRTLTFLSAGATANFIRPIVSQPYNVSVLQVSNLIMPPTLLPNANSRHTFLSSLVPPIPVAIPHPLSPLPVVSPVPVITPVPLPSPVPVITPVPVESPVPVITPVPVESPVPVITPVPVVSPVPVITPVPVKSPVPVITPVPVVSPVPVITPVPVKSPVPVITPVPVVSPVPVITPVPVKSPVPVIIPVPVKSPAPVITPVPVESPVPVIKPVPIMSPVPVASPVPVVKPVPVISPVPIVSPVPVPVVAPVPEISPEPIASEVPMVSPGPVGPPAAVTGSDTPADSTPSDKPESGVGRIGLNWALVILITIHQYALQAHI